MPDNPERTIRAGVIPATLHHDEITYAINAASAMRGVVQDVLRTLGRSDDFVKKKIPVLTVRNADPTRIRRLLGHAYSSDDEVYPKHILAAAIGLYERQPSNGLGDPKVDPQTQRNFLVREATLKVLYHRMAGPGSAPPGKDDIAEQMIMERMRNYPFDKTDDKTEFIDLPSHA